MKNKSLFTLCGELIDAYPNDSALIQDFLDYVVDMLVMFNPDLNVNKFDNIIPFELYHSLFIAYSAFRKVGV